MNLGWYPGHMAKAMRRLEQELPGIDALIELCDARIPLSSHNPALEELRGGKRCLRVLGRADLADEKVTERWKRALPHTIALDVTRPGAAGLVFPALRQLLGDVLARRAEKGQEGRPLRVSVVGVPNIGKSTLINNLLGRKAARAEDRPGVTRNGQWYAPEKGWMLFDTPGLLWPRLENKQTALHLAFTGAMPDEIMDTETLAARLLSELWRRDPEILRARYRLEATEAEKRDAEENALYAEPDGEAGEGSAAGDEAFGFLLLERLARNRGYLVSGGEGDLERASRTLLDEFRAGKTGRISLEEPAEPA